MAIEGICQPEILQVDENIRLRKFDGIYDFAYDWYQDEETVYLVDGVRKSYSQETLKCMYEYLDKQGELYFIEVLEGNAYLPIGDVTFWKDDMPIVIGNKYYRGKGIAKKVIGALIERGKTLGYDTLHVNEIYDFNIASRKCFESMGFVACEKTEKGNRFVLENNMDLRLAKFEDLPQLREMYKAIVNHMRQQGLEIWDEIYPCEFLAEDVQEKRLYILIEKELIVGAFALCESNAGEKAVEWKWNTDKVLYLDRLGVNVNCLKRGIASRMLNEATSLAKEKNVSSLRLFVVDTNEPAINLYLKNGFEKATGVFEEVIDEDLVLVEYGFEKVVVANQNQYKVEFGKEEDISSWMKLVNKISWNFPGLETDENIEEHRNTVLKFMRKQQALCIKDKGAVVAVLLFSRNHNMICCLGVSPNYRRMGIASKLLEKALDELDRSKEITVSTFRENDAKGIAPRALYKKFGFVEDELIEEFGYPNQRFVLNIK